MHGLTWPTTPLNEGYLGPFEWKMTDVKGEYQTLAVI